MFICGCLMMFMYMLMLCDSIFINLWSISYLFISGWSGQYNQDSL
jgi:hypothetical protein